MPGPPLPTVYSPYYPSLQLRMPPEAFDVLINKTPIQLYWLRAHSCPCTFGGPTPGNPDPACKNCGGLAYYWDTGVGPFSGLITFIHTSPTPDEPGARMDVDQGLMVNGEPSLTIPYTDGMSGVIWTQAALMDQFVEVNAQSRFNVNLTQGVRNVVPYQNNVSIAASGAVTIYDTVTNDIVTNVTYTVSGRSVSLTSGYAQGTNFMLEYYAAPSYIAYRVAGMPAHVRPFDNLNYPRRFRLQNLDLFIRSRQGGTVPYV